MLDTQLHTLTADILSRNSVASAANKPAWTPGLTLEFVAARLWRAFLIVNVIALLACSVGMRAWDLGRVPGINGDEAWYGVQAEMLLAGENIAWKTPTGNWLNPFFFGPMVLLHSFCEPSFTVLRVPALLSGIAALLLNYWLARRACGPIVALVSTLILAVLPINIAYSRFAWDASQSLLFTLPVIYLPLLAIVEPTHCVRWSRLAFVALLLAIVVHPTNIFVVPWLLILHAYAWSDRFAALVSNPSRRWVAGIASLLLGILLLNERLPTVLLRLIELQQMAQFAIDFGQLFSGITVFEYISGGVLKLDGSPNPENWTRITFDANTWVIVAMVAWFVYRKAVVQSVPLEIVLGSAWLACVLSFYLIAGPAAIAPHFERYAICLIAPTVLVVSRALVWWMQPTTRFSYFTAPLLIAAAWSLLYAVEIEYFAEFRRTGGQSHRTFRTAEIEPKLAALKLAIQLRTANSAGTQSTGGASGTPAGRASGTHKGLGDGTIADDEPLQIAISEWWLYWPLRYLTSRHATIHVELHDATFAIDPARDRLLTDNVVCIEFADSEAAWRIEQAMAERRRAGKAAGITKQLVHDASGRALIAVFVSE